MTTLFIIAITVIASMYAWRTYGAMEKYSFNPKRVVDHQEWYRFFTSSVLHADWSHLIFNMFSLFFFGKAVEQYFNFYNGNGAAYLIALYLSAMVVSEIGTLFRHKSDSGYNSIGASGAVSAVVFAGIFFNPTSQILVMFIPMPGFAFGAIYLIYSAYASKNQLTAGHINHDAHLYGSVWGVVFTAISEPQTIGAFFDALVHFQLF